MNDQITTFFPQAFFTSINLLDKDYLIKLQRLSLDIKNKHECGGKNWLLRPYNTMDTYELNKDKNFKLLLDKIEEKVFLFTKAHKSNRFYKIKESWLNIYDKNDQQEFHCHADCTFSAVFFLKTSADCAKIIFENPTEPDMKPILNVEGPDPLNYKRCIFEPIENSLLIFRSYMRHMVEKQKTDSERITIAVNL
tara:strand:+ start:391 stop:972 length:582 start_codon:yes stop_codon:yes gene_type:complete